MCEYLLSSLHLGSVSTSAPQPPAPGPEPETPHVLIALGAELEGLFDRLARRAGDVTLVQYRVLELLARHHPEPLEPHELARALAMGSNHVTMILDQLQARGLVERRPHPHDRRRRRVYATDAGRESAARLGVQVRAVEQRIMDAALTPAERDELTALARRVRGVLAEIVVHETRARPGP